MTHKYLMMLDDAVIVSIDSIRDGDRLTMVYANSIIDAKPPVKYPGTLGPSPD